MMCIAQAIAAAKDATNFIGESRGVPSMGRHSSSRATLTKHGTMQPVAKEPKLAALNDMPQPVVS